MRAVNWLSCICAVGLTGCSLYPIPDDVAGISTEDVVRYARCEMRSAILFHMVNYGIIQPDKGIADQIAAATEKAKIEAKIKKPLLKPEERKLLKLASVAMVYTFDFNITENNKADGGVGFRLPWAATNVLDISGKAAIDLTRQGSRVFSAQDRWDNLMIDSKRCDVPWQRQGDIVYPLAGSIGVGRVVETFIDIDGQGGAKDSFVDILTFTTDVSGGANASVKLDPVPRQLRPVSASAALSASRKDTHKLTISLTFPRPSAPQPDAITGVTRVDGYLNAPFERSADWQARYNLCVADARAREDAFKQLRQQAPEVYCITYADEFFAQQAERQIPSSTTQTGTKTAEKLLPDRTVPERRVRPNLRPF